MGSDSRLYGQFRTGIGVNLAISGSFVLCYYAVVQFSSMTKEGDLEVRWMIPVVGICVMALVVGSLVVSAVG